MNSTNKHRIPILSFFSGGGFLDMGFEKAGFSIIWTNENNDLFAKMHSHGISAWRKARGNNVKAEIFNTKSIEEIAPEEIIKEAFPDKVPDLFGVIGGPPCQDFSAAGKNAGFDGERGRLTTVFFDYIQAMQPAFFVFENVQNLWNHKKHRGRLKQVLESLDSFYHIDHKILNAIEFGVPQDRFRLFIVGIRRTESNNQVFLKSGFHFPWPSNKKYKDALTKFNWPNTNTFQNGTVKPDNIPLELCTISALLGDDENIPNYDEHFLPHSKKFWEIEEGNTRRKSFKRLHRYRYSPTACYGNNEVHLHPFLPRRLSVRETLRLQTVDDSYVLQKEIGLTHKFKMIGNGVPVKLAKAIAQASSKFIQNTMKLDEK